MNALERHRQLMQHFRSVPPRPRSDFDVVHEEHRFLWNDGDRDASSLSWEQRLAKRYHDKLFKEYALADMTRYREGQVGLRWRTESEVIDGKGQFVCGNKRCTSIEDLASFELNFAYVERGERRQVLVKLRVCPRCERRLHYRQHKERKKERKRRRAEEDARDGSKKKKKKQKKEMGPRRSGDGEEESARERRRGHDGCDGSSSGSDDDGATEGHDAAARGGDACTTEAAADVPAGSEIWSARPVADKSQAEEMDDYFDQLCGSLLM